MQNFISDKKNIPQNYYGPNIFYIIYNHQYQCVKEMCNKDVTNAI